MDGLIEFYLPNNTTASKFNLKNTEDKVKIIQIGMDMFEQAYDSMKNLTDNDYKFEIHQIKENHLNEITSLNEIIQNFKKRIDTINHSHQENIKNIKIQIEHQFEQINKIKLDNLELSIDTKNSKIQELQDKINLLNDNKYKLIRENEDSIRNQYEGKLSSMRTQYEERLENERNKYNDFINRQQNSSLVGADGETELESILNKFYPKCEIENMATQPGRGDFLLKFDKFIMVESKNYSRNVNTEEIKKFYRDITSNDDYHSGIFCSLKSGVANKEDFSVTIQSGKPVIFLHNLKQNPNNIKHAVNILNTIMTLDRKILNDKEKMDKINQNINEFKKNIKKRRKLIDDTHKKSIALCEKDHELILNFMKIIK